jgi:hypothetical protein
LRPAIRQRQLRGKSRLRPAQQTRQHLASLIGIIIDGLLAHDHQPGCLAHTHRLQQFCHCQRLQFDLRLHQQRAIRTDSQTGTQSFLAGAHAAGHHHHLARQTGFLEAHGLLDRDFIKRVHRHLDVSRLDT